MSLQGCWSEVGNFLEKYRSGILAGVIIAIIVEVSISVMFHLQTESENKKEAIQTMQAAMTH
jgi:hypothetical protein